MFIPIGDENPRERTPYVNYTLLGINIGVFLLFTFPAPSETILVHWALWPGRLEWQTLFTSMFLHANLLHLLGNMLFLWIFGDNVEDRLGHLGYLAFYLACGLAADAAHIATHLTSLIPTLGASGAISGVIGAYVVFFPRHRVKMLLWLWFYIDILLIPAFWWIGVWFAEQLFLAYYLEQRGVSGVAYLAHIGGFVAGAATAAVVRLLTSGTRPAARVPQEVRDASRTTSRRPFITIDDEPGMELEDEPQDKYAVLLLTDELHSVGRIAQIVAEVTGEKARDGARRLEATRGMVARGIPRVDAERIQRALSASGLPSAIILYHPANFPPTSVIVESASWDDRLIRLGVCGQLLPVAWPAPFLYLGARVGRTSFIDVIVNRRTAFRIPEGVPMTQVDPRRRREGPADLSDLARATLEYRKGAALNEGIHVLAKHGAWGWLAFKDFSEYDDYAFWVYNLILSHVPLHRT